MSSRRFAILTALPLALMAAGPENVPQDATNTVVYYRARNWEAFSGKAMNGSTFCGIKTATQADGRGLMIRHRTGEDRLIVRAYKPSWSIPDGTAISLGMAFGPNAAWNINGTGSGNVTEWSIPRDAMESFENQFRLSASLVITFPGGNEAPWNVTLAGSNAIGLALQRCMREMATRAAPTQPFSGAPAATGQTAETPTGTPPTQPFTATQPTPSR